MNIENLIESVGEGLRKIGCKVRKRNAIMATLTDPHVKEAMKVALASVLHMEANHNLDLEYDDDDSIMQEIEFTDLLDKLEKEHKIYLEHKPLCFDITYPKSIKNNSPSMA